MPEKKQASSKSPSGDTKPSPDSKHDLLGDVKERADDVMDEIKEGATTLWAKVKAGAERVGEFAEDATELGKLKLEIHKLEGKLDKQFLEMGKRLWELHQEDKLTRVKSTFAEDFQEVEKLSKELNSTKKKAEKIALMA